MIKQFPLLAIILLLNSCNYKKNINKVAISEIECSFELSSDSIINAEIKAQSTTTKMRCFQFTNNTNRDLYYLMIDYMNMISSSEQYFYVNGEKIPDISCWFSATKKVSFKIGETYQAFVIENEISHSYDSSFVKFMFYDQLDSSETAYIFKLFPNA